jgi:hypothetical protein
MRLWNQMRPHDYLQPIDFFGRVETDGETLFCPGIPGGGKTILTSVVIDNLQRKFRKRKDVASIAYLYCNFRR